VRTKTHACIHLLTNTAILFGRCISFLSNGGFDFNKLFRSGIPFLNHEQETQVRTPPETPNLNPAPQNPEIKPLKPRPKSSKTKKKKKHKTPKT